MTDDLSDSIFKIDNPGSFTQTTLGIFKFQSEWNAVYRDFISTLGRRVCDVKNLADIPFLPAEFFKSRKVVTQNGPDEIVFESSRTEGSAPSYHFVRDLKLYERSFLESFRYFYGEPSDYFIAMLLPSYTQRQNSSLIYMMKGLINKSINRDSSFYGNDPEGLIRKIKEAKSKGHKTFLLGVSFALLDLAEKYSPDLSGTIVMETGGMKGRRKETIERNFTRY
jgi:hypothetical protein